MVDSFHKPGVHESFSFICFAVRFVLAIHLERLNLIVCDCNFSQDLKEYTDAEGLMSLPTSDFHKPTVCTGRYKYSIASGDGNYMPRCITAGSGLGAMSTQSSPPPPQLPPPTSTGAMSKSMAVRDPKDFTTNAYPNEMSHRQMSIPNNGSHLDKVTHYSNNLIKASFNNSGDLASVDSSDTYASCQTHPFLSQGDLTGEMADITCTLAELDVDDLYFTSLDKERPSTSADMKSKSQVKKSASGDASLLSLGACAPMDEVLVSDQIIDAFFVSFIHTELLFFLKLLENISIV